MTEREKLEKIVKGLTEALMVMEVHVPERYRGYSIEAIKDAIALLKTQEPRVMTLEEVIAAEPGAAVWLEDYDKQDVIGGLVKETFSYTKVIDFLIVEKEVNNEVTADLGVYGEQWRCWTSRPSDEQRKAVKWID